MLAGVTKATAGDIEPAHFRSDGGANENENQFRGPADQTRAKCFPLLFHRPILSLQSGDRAIASTFRCTEPFPIFRRVDVDLPFGKWEFSSLITI